MYNSATSGGNPITGLWLLTTGPSWDAPPKKGFKYSKWDQMTWMISDDLGYLHDLGHLQLMMFNGGIAFYGDIQWDIQWEVSAEKRIHILGFVFSELISP